MSPTCPVLYSPMLTTVDTETFMTTIKSQSQEERREMNVYICARLHTYLCVYSVNTVYSVCKCYLFVIACKLELHDILSLQVYHCINTVLLYRLFTSMRVWPCVLSRMYRAEKLPNTNLVFLITDAKATCLSCDPRPLRQAEQPCILSLNS